MTKTIINRFESKYIKNKGRLKETAYRAYHGFTMINEDNDCFQNHADLEVNGRKINIKSSLASFYKTDKNLQDAVREYLELDYSNEYAIIIDTQKFLNTDKCKLVAIEMDSQEMEAFMLDNCTIDGGKLRLKKSDLFLAKWFFARGIR